MQGLADGIKLALKEDLIPAMVDKPVYVLAPIISTVAALSAFSVSSRSESTARVCMAYPVKVW